jgi:hypothetical protein
MSENSNNGSCDLYNVDKGLFIWGDYIEDKQAEDREFMTHISRFKLKTIPGNGREINELLHLNFRFHFCGEFLFKFLEQ